MTIDIELNKIDINQCDPEYGEPTNGLDVFMGSHLCQPTTKVSELLRVIKIQSTFDISKSKLSTTGILKQIFWSLKIYFLISAVWN